jgi:SAM-dependent methyltransferase
MSSNAPENTRRSFQDNSDIRRWILERNGFASSSDLRSYLRDKRRILDAGCGNGRVTALLAEHAPAEAAIVAIDLVAADVAARNLAGYSNVQVRQADLLNDLSGLGRFDFIYCQEVLHHTADPPRAFRGLCDLLHPPGEIAIYVYKQKAPAREFVDDYVRERIKHLPYHEAMQTCREITLLGRALWDSGQKVCVPGVRMLGIEPGEYDLQRFVYHFFMKCFWNPSLSFDDNVAINYDWYHPEIATRHTLEEVEAWFRNAELEITHRCVDFYGITVRGARR